MKTCRRHGAALTVHKETLDTTLKHVEELARRKALDDFLKEIRVEERHYVREQKALLVARKSMIRQERVYFRNIPLSSWMEHEMPFEEVVDMEKFAQGMALFASEDFRNEVKQLR